MTTKKIDDMNDAVNRKLKTCFIDFVANLQQKLLNCEKASIVIETELRRKGIIFRSDTLFEGKV